MKKLLAWLMAFVVALFNNVEYTKMDAHEYDSSKIYYLDVEEARPDYRYQRSDLDINSSEVSCRYSNYSQSAKRVQYGADQPSIKAYWFESPGIRLEDITDSEKSITLTSEGRPIYAPYDCILTTENLSANDGTTMEVVCTISGQERYRISISGMSKWYCDKLRTTTGFHTWDNPEPNGRKHTFSAGNVLGYQSSNTVIVVNSMSGGQVVDTGLTMRDFFLQQ